MTVLLALREIRKALHIPETAEDHAKLEALSDLVGRSICHPEDMAARADVASQEPLGDWGYRVQEAYGADLMHKNWQTSASKRTI